MKKMVLVACALLCMSFVWAKKSQPDAVANWNYEIQPTIGQAAEGSAIVRVWSYSKKSDLAIGQASKNAVHGILFKGYASSNDGSQIIGRDALIHDSAVEKEKAAYFASFFADGGAYQRYVTEINNGIPDQIVKVGKQYKIGVTVVVMVDQLRQRLEADGIIAPANVVVGKMPTIMVVPSLNAYPDYESALRDNSEMAQAIAAINSRLVKRGFEVKNLSSALTSLKNEAREEQVTKSIEYDESIAETAIDQLRRVAKADIWIEIDWKENEMRGGSLKTLTFTMSAIDAYTDFVIGGVTPSTSHVNYSSTFNVSGLIESAIQGQFDPFCNTLVTYFNTLVEKGRPIKLRVLTWKDFDETLMSEYDGVELHEIIEDWLADNTVNGKFGASDINPAATRMTIEQVRIPLVNNKGRDLDPMRWARELKNMLNANYGIESNLSSKGLGEILLILGSK